MKLNSLLLILALAAVFTVRGAFAQEATNRPARALPGQIKLPVGEKESTDSAVQSPPAFEGISRPLTLTVTPALELPQGVLAFDREMATVAVTDGAPEARFIFHFTNTSPAQLAITNVAVACGCTAVDLPPLPWPLKPGESGRLPVTLEVAGKRGEVVKSLQVRTDRGMKTIYVRADVAPPVDAE